jgi:chromosome segregation ATPase
MGTVCVVTFGALIALGVGLFQLRGERNRVQGENDALNERVVLLQKKYREEKARVGGLQRAKSALEGQKRTLQSELSKLQEENASLAAQRGTSEKALRGRVASLRARADELSKELSEVKAAHEVLGNEHARSTKEYEERVNLLTAENQSMDAELKRQEQRLARCALNNVELCGLVDELLSKYESKGVMTSILQKEPFTQVEKAEMEKMLQEYEDRKADHSIERFQEQASE